MEELNLDLSAALDARLGHLTPAELRSMRWMIDALLRTHPNPRQVIDEAVLIANETLSSTESLGADQVLKDAQELLLTSQRELPPTV